MSAQYNFTLFFKGWAQCRLATDPDPDYEPRGVSGYTFALPGEPDLDRIIRFQNSKNVVNRSFGPKVGVHITDGYFFKTSGKQGSTRFEEKQPINKNHPLYGAAINLLNRPTFSSHNSILVYNGYGIIDPFQFEIKTRTVKGKRAVIRRAFHIKPGQPDLGLNDIPINDLSDYIINVDATNIPPLNNAENSFNPENRLNIWGSPNMLYESGILDPVAYRQTRLTNLQKERTKLLQEKSVNKVKLAALNKRISELEINSPKNRRTAQLGAKVLIPYSLNSTTATVNGKEIEAGPAWALELWMGGWDADSLCFYIQGTVEISLGKNPL